MISMSSLNSPDISQYDINNLQSCKSMNTNFKNKSYEFVSNIKDKMNNNQN
jgi:hypothetical protein